MTSYLGAEEVPALANEKPPCHPWQPDGRKQLAVVAVLVGVHQEVHSLEPIAAGVHNANWVCLV